MSGVDQWCGLGVFECFAAMHREGKDRYIYCTLHFSPTRITMKTPRGADTAALRHNSRYFYSGLLVENFQDFAAT